LRRVPVKKLSTQSTWQPRSNRLSARCDPRKPAPPEIRTLRSRCIAPRFGLAKPRVADGGKLCLVRIGRRVCVCQVILRARFIVVVGEDYRNETPGQQLSRNPLMMLVPTIGRCAPLGAPGSAPSPWSISRTLGAGRLVGVSLLLLLGAAAVVAAGEGDNGDGASGNYQPSDHVGPDGAAAHHSGAAGRAILV
jgi:hypothetical protein